MNAREPIVLSWSGGKDSALALEALLLRDLPSSVDPCGERGEFHTFVTAGPGFSQPLSYTIGEVVLRDGRFAYCDLA
jgi:diphthamide synthase (EF-2-diphthine--ammonia ligase)